MTYKQAIKKLVESGWAIVKQGKGSHLVIRKDDKTAVISQTSNMSWGMQKKIRTYLRR